MRIRALQLIKKMVYPKLFFEKFRNINQRYAFASYPSSSFPSMSSSTRLIRQLYSSSTSQHALTQISHRSFVTNLCSSTSEEKHWFIFSEQHLLLTKNMEILKNPHTFLQKDLLIRCLPFHYDSLSCVTAELPKNTLIPSGLQWRDLIELYHLDLPKEIIAPAGKARQLLEWDRSHQFCGECGSKTSPATDEYCLTCTNTSCNRLFYPKISPTVVVAVERDQEILLARSPHFPPKIYGMIAGFVEAGETLEQTVRREVWEETKIEIDNIRYFSSQPWPRPNELVLGFQANYKSGNIICDSKEIEAAAFFPFNALPETFPGNSSILKWLLKDFCNRQEKKLYSHEMKNQSNHNHLRRPK